MIKKIKQLLRDNIDRQNRIIAQNEELLWAATFHDSIKGKKGIEHLALNIGRWAGNYAFFYVLNRILNDYEPKRIVEFGLGESSKFVSTYLDHYLINSEHVIIEQDANWKNIFENKFKLSDRSSIKVMPLVKKNYKGFDYNSYENIESTITSKFDLYLIDGPFGSPNYSRFDVYYLLEKLSKEDDFILILDDCHRNGEMETANEIMKMLKEKGITAFEKTYKGVKNVKVIGTYKYKYSSTL